MPEGNAGDKTLGLLIIAGAVVLAIFLLRSRTETPSSPTGPGEAQHVVDTMFEEIEQKLKEMLEEESADWDERMEAMKENYDKQIADLEARIRELEKLLRSGPGHPIARLFS